MDADGTTSASVFCGYHRAFGSGTDQTVYGDLPFPPSGDACDAGQAPNGNLAADGMVSTLSHELNEAITDPLSQIAWNDSVGHEIGDMCAQTYGPPLGSTDPANPGSSEYNQVINGGKYYTQTEFSNHAFAAYGIGKGCAQSEALAQGAATNPGSAPKRHLHVRRPAARSDRYQQRPAGPQGGRRSSLTPSPTPCPPMAPPPPASWSPWPTPPATWWWATTSISASAWKRGREGAAP